MAKKKAAKPAKAVVPVPAGGTQPNVLTIRGSARWKTWLERIATKLRLKPTVVIDQALAEYAEKRKLEEPPPRMEP